LTTCPKKRNSSGEGAIAAGGFHADRAWSLTSGFLDANETGSLELSDAPFTGTYSVDASSGRGTATLNIPTIGAIDVVFYVFSGHQLIWLGMNTSQFLFCGSAIQQTGGPYSQSSLSGKSIIAMSSSVGLLTADGNGNVTGAIDSIDGSLQSSGNAVTNQAFTGTYAVAGNGTGTPNIFNQSFVLWFINQNSAFVMEAPNSAVFQARFIEPQAKGPLSNASISGPFGSGSDTNSLDATIGFDTNSLFGTFSSDGAGNVRGSLPRS
jgi:hypothetical protein